MLVVRCNVYRCVYIYIWTLDWLSRADRINYDNIFKSRLLRFVRPLENSVFTCHNPIGIKYVTRLMLGFSKLRYHKLKKTFLVDADPLCSCSTAIGCKFLGLNCYQMAQVEQKCKLDFLGQICSKRVFRVYKRKSEFYHQIQYIGFSLSTNFWLTQTLMNFWTRPSQKTSFWSKK